MLEYERQAEERAREQEAMAEERDRMLETELRIRKEQERIAQEEYEMRQYYEAETLKHAQEIKLHQEEVRRHQERVRDHERRIMDHEASSEAFAKVIAMPATKGATRAVSFLQAQGGRNGARANGNGANGVNGANGSWGRWTDLRFYFEGGGRWDDGLFWHWAELRKSSTKTERKGDGGLHTNLRYPDWKSYGRPLGGLSIQIFVRRLPVERSNRHSLSPKEEPGNELVRGMLGRRTAHHQYETKYEIRPGRKLFEWSYDRMKVELGVGTAWDWDWIG
jgi:hypothetical protein